MDEALVRKDVITDALSSALKADKDEIKRLNENIEIYVNNQHIHKQQADEHSTQKADIDKLTSELESALSTPKRCICSTLNELESGSESLQTYTSHVAAAQLTHGNPNIIALSDKKRPTKLAEAFSELYDNEWTDAYFAFEDDPRNTTTKEDIVKNLRNVLLNCFRQCTEISTTQIQSIKALLLSPSAVSSMTRPKQELSTEQAEAVNDLRKQTTSVAIESVKEVIAKQYAESGKYPSLKIFIEKCAEVCWLMVVQSPPVFIDDRHKSGDGFDKDIFKPYTKGGRAIDYVVWPPVYLHRGGPLLCKGTAQGK